MDFGCVLDEIDDSDWTAVKPAVMSRASSQHRSEHTVTASITSLSRHRTLVIDSSDEDDEPVVSSRVQRGPRKSVDQFFTVVNSATETDSIPRTSLDTSAPAVSDSIDPHSSTYQHCRSCVDWL